MLRTGTPMEEPWSPVASVAATRAASPTESVNSIATEDGLRTRVILVGIGGATCSGKTTLAKHLRHILPGSMIVHQDDFAPPSELIPMHPVHNVQDWDSAPGAIDWPRLAAFLRYLKEHGGEFPPGHYSHDHLNEQKECPIPAALVEDWTGIFERVNEASRVRGEKIVWRIVDGFLLYWHKDVVDQLDVRVFLRVPGDVLKQRRHERHGYHTAEGALWRDPPGYWERIVWPAYVDAHEKLFVGGDVEHGLPKLRHRRIPDVVEEDVSMGEVEEPGQEGGVDGLVLIEGMKVNMEEMVRHCCEILREQVSEYNS